MKKIILLLLTVVSFLQIHAQYPDWENYLNGERIAAMAEYGDDMYIATRGGGLVKINRNTGESTFYNKSNSGLPSQKVIAVAIDHDGVVWLSGGDGIVRFDGTEWTYYDTSNSDIPADFVTGLMVDADNNLWCTARTPWITWEGDKGLVFKYNGVDWETVYSPGEDESDVDYNLLAVDNDSIIWLGLSDSYWGYSYLVKIDGYQAKSYEMEESVSALSIDEAGNKWIVSGEDLIMFDDFTFTVIDSANFGVPFDRVYDIDIDGDNNIWLGTKQGLVKYDGADWTVYDSNDFNFEKDGIPAVDADADNNIWFVNVSSFSGLMKYDGMDFIKQKTSTSPVRKRSIRKIAFDSNNLMWLGAYEEGLISFDGTNRTVYDVTNADVPCKVSSLAIDAADNKWLSTLDCGLMKFDGANWTVYDTINSDIPDNRIGQIAFDVDGNKWFGAGDRGLVKFDGTDWTVYDTLNSEIPSNTVGAIAIDLDDNKWFATEDGLVKFDGVSFVLFSETNSDLPTHHINNIAIDDDNTVWLATRKGIVEIDSTIWTIYGGYEKEDVVVDNDNNKWFCGYSSYICSSNSGVVMKYDGSEWTTFNTDNSGLSRYDTHVLAVDADNNIWGSSGRNLDVLHQDGITTVPEEWSTTTNTSAITFLKNNPNPFGAETIIHWESKVNGKTILLVYDVFGKKVATLVDADMPAGHHEIGFNGEMLSSGIYFYKLKVESATLTGKMVVER